MARCSHHQKQHGRLAKVFSAKANTLACIALTLFGANTVVYAEGTAKDIANTDTYGIDFFMPYEPQTLYDILEKIPAANSALIAMSSTTQNRGFGSSGDQILINNKRFSGKENDLRKELDNIQARDVEYVELIRGTRSGLDVRSEGVVVNVILKKQVEASILWSAAAVKTSGMNAEPRGSLIYSDSYGGLKYRLGIERFANLTKLVRRDLYTDTADIQTDEIQRIRPNKYIENQLTTKLEYSLSKDTAIQLSGLFAWIYVDADIDINSRDFIEQTLNRDTITLDWHRDQWELSGDITHQVNQANHLKVLFISNRAASNDQTWKVSHELGGDMLSYELPRDYVSSENVLRGNWSYTLNNQHTFDSGAEIAINQFDEHLQFISHDDAPYHSTEINDIEEKRYELFGNYNYAVSPRLNLQSSLVYERSTMDVFTDFMLVDDINEQAEKYTSRSFSYLKPRLNIRYDYSDLVQLRFNYERTVSQLDLRDFVPEFNRDETRLEETNPDLKPEVRDELSFSIEKQLQETDGSITITPYYHDITDLIVEVPLSEYSGDGNIDSGKEYGVKFETNFGLEALGIENTVISANYTWRNSEMIHPFTGETTDIDLLSDNDWQFKINKTDILPGLSASFTLSNRSPYLYTRHDFQGTRENDIKGRGFIEYQLSKHLKLKLEGTQLFGHKSDFKRRRHNGLFTETDVLRYEHRFDERPARYVLTLSGQF